VPAGTPLKQSTFHHVSLVSVPTGWWVRQHARKTRVAVAEIGFYLQLILMSFSDWWIWTSVLRNWLFHGRCYPRIIMYALKSIRRKFWSKGGFISDSRVRKNSRCVDAWWVYYPRVMYALTLVDIHFLQWCYISEKKRSNSKYFTNTDYENLNLRKSTRELVWANLYVAEYKLLRSVLKLF